MVITTCVLRSGGDFDSDYVDNLYRQWNRNGDGYFVPFTDLDDGNLDIGDSRLDGWWSKLVCFRLKGCVIYFDLDTCIYRSVERLVRVVASESPCFYALRPFRKSEEWASGIMAWNGDFSWLYREWSEEDKQDTWDQRYISRKLAERN